VDLVGGHGPADGRAINRESADHSAAFCIAAVLVRGRLGHEDYEAAIADPDVLALMARVSLVEDSEASGAFPRRFPSRMTVALSDGRSLEAAQDGPPPMDEAGMAAKLEALWPAGRARAWPFELSGTAPAFPG